MQVSHHFGGGVGDECLTYILVENIARRTSVLQDRVTIQTLRPNCIKSFMLRILLLTDDYTGHNAICPVSFVSQSASEIKMPAR
ncbi:hypothetical protein BD410DRAFT_781864 [Rickenella mellea]|uniref:Uncharacterized protein n=1 Tax=Rickenella mellea TaxID=50990 RepID=A0A4Y7QJV6_9AGAM|nr:hypothetical protein BD410DRAFT_781864 [Rickenella mellea]